MSTSASDNTPSSRSAGVHHDVAFIRAGAAVLWAVIYLLALHGQRVLSSSNIPTLAGLLLAVYPVIDLTAAVTERRRGHDSGALRTAMILDGLTILSLLISTLSLDTQAVLMTFGAWALLAGLLQLTSAWRAHQPRRVQLPLLISGAISAVVGVTFITMATERVAHLSNLGGYAILGAVFFLVWSVISRINGPSTGTLTNAD